MQTFHKFNPVLHIRNDKKIAGENYWVVMVLW